MFGVWHSIRTGQDEEIRQKQSFSDRLGAVENTVKDVQNGNRNIQNQLSRIEYRLKLPVHGTSAPTIDVDPAGYPVAVVKRAIENPF